ncbi:MAG: PAS domain S-box protein, partial [Desulfamplus sp.]|nr:PAS domain S-box protein [Desulfamplus sp.]
IKDSQGNIVNYLGIQEDISKQKHNELQLRILQQAVDKSPVSVVVTDAEGNISYVNPYFTAQTGYTYKEVVGKSPRILNSGYHTSEFYESLWKTISNGNIWKGELCNIKKNGEKIWEQAIITPIVNNDKNSQCKGSRIEHYVAVKLDITDARKSEQAIRDSEYKFKSIITSMEQGFWMVDNNWKTMEVNPAICSILGIYEKDIIGRSIYDFMDDEYQQKIKSYIRTWSPNSKSSFEMVLIRQDNGHVHCLISPTPLFDQQKRQIGAFAVITDFTKRKEMEQQLIEAKESAEKASRIKSDFVANMSHEIRTPMNSILGFLELVLEEELSLSQRKKISIAHSSANALLTLLNDILDFSKIEQKRMTTEVKSFDLRKLVKTRLELLTIKAAQKGLELHYEFSSDIAERYLGDPMRIGQVIVNIVGNAIKFTTHGKVEIKVEKYTPEKDTILFSISDTGIGILPEHKKSVFKPFTQADPSTTRRFGGTGLGTAISKELVEMMGGSIWFESRKEGGTVFYFTIRMLQAPGLEEEKDDKKMNYENTSPGFNILVADDLQENVLLTKLFLQRKSHRVTGVNNGLEAVNEFKKGKFDVILMDVHMPEMDGIEATLKIREIEHGTGRATPIIAVTASVMNEEKDIYERAGMNAVIGKPISFKELNALILSIVKTDQQTTIFSKENNPSEASIYPEKNRLVEGKTDIYDKVGFDDEKTGIDKENSILTEFSSSPEINTSIDIKKAVENWSNLSVFGDILSRFYNENKDISQKIEFLIKENNISEIHRITHAIKGLSGNLSLLAIFSIFTKMDRASVDKDLNIINSLLPELKKEIDKLPSYIEIMSNKLNDTGETEVNGTKGQKRIEEFGTDKTNTDKLKSLLSDLMAACEQYTPDEVYPFFKELQFHISHSDLKSLADKIEQFDFDGAKNEAMVLLGKL